MAGWTCEWEKKWKKNDDAQKRDNIAPAAGANRRSVSRDRRKTGTGKLGAKATAKAKAKAGGGGGAAAVAPTTTTATAPPSDATAPPSATAHDAKTMAHIPIEELELARGESRRFKIKDAAEGNWAGFACPNCSEDLLYRDLHHRTRNACGQ